MSVYSVELGRTCDDSHTVLIDSHYQSKISQPDRCLINNYTNLNSNINSEWQRHDETPHYNDDIGTQKNLTESFKTISSELSVRVQIL